MDIFKAVTLQALHCPIGGLSPLRTRGKTRTVLIGEILQRVHQPRIVESFGFDAANHGEILQTLLDTAREINRSPAQTALRWVMDQPYITSAIVGARNAQQLGETLGAGGWRLPAAALAKLDKISAQPHRYPRAFEESMVERRNSAIKMPGA